MIIVLINVEKIDGLNIQMDNQNVGYITTENTDSLLISIEQPYTNIVEIVSFTDVIEGEGTDCYYSKFFRWGINGKSYSDWVSLTNSNLQALQLDPNNDFWIEYRYDHNGYCQLEFLSISLEIVTKEGKISCIPQIKCCDNQYLPGSQNLNIQCCESKWDPYNVGKGGLIYSKLSGVVNDMFGICVKYFKTEADQRSRDVILKEYSLLNVIQTDEIKILFPDNELPTRDIQYNPLMMDYAVEFEVHITKSEFRKTFGNNSRPEVGDYLYLERFLNKVYEVNSVAEPDDFLYEGSYWRVSLTIYQNRTSVQHSDEFAEERDQIIDSVEDRFREERETEFVDTRKPNQYNTIGTQFNDYVRRAIDKNLIIREENIYNSWTIISKYYYDLSSIDKGIDTIIYRHNDILTTTDSRAFSFWFRPKFKQTEYHYVSLGDVEESNGKTKIKLPTGDSLPVNLVVGDWIKISASLYINGIYKITELITDESEDGLIIDLDWDYFGEFNSAPRFKKLPSNKFMIYESDSNQESISFEYTSETFHVKIGDKLFQSGTINSNEIKNDNWYSIIINVNNIANQVSIFGYKLISGGSNTADRRNDRIESLFAESFTVADKLQVQQGEWKLLGSDTHLTNIRIWKTPIEEEQHELILSQYVVNDASQALIIDNAVPQLRLHQFTNPR